jgi:multidrug efflux pump subunit AcrA (membrane-fusion protein)
VTDVPVTDNQHVNAGDVLTRIDDRDYRVAVDQAEAQVSPLGATGSVPATGGCASHILTDFPDPRGVSGGRAGEHLAVSGARQASSAKIFFFIEIRFCRTLLSA